mgnify:CR=1 FL=1
MTEPSDPNEPANPELPLVRSAERVPFRATVQFRKEQTRVTVRIVDISTHGARLSAVHHLRKGDTFWLTLPTLAPIQAVAVWADEFIVGCKFSAPLNAYVLENLLRVCGG